MTQIDMSQFFGEYEPEQKREMTEESSVFEKLDSLKPLHNLEYRVRLTNFAPYRHEGVGRDGDEYVSYKLEVMLMDIIPNKDKNVSKGQRYALWLNERAYDNFYRFWKETARSAPDERVFSIERLQKVSQSSGRNYDIWTFGEV